MQVNLSPNPNAFYYTSAPTSPKRYNHNDLYFLSMPTSPTRSTTPDPTHGLSPFSDKFEFEGSKRFYHYDINGSQKSQELAIAYADELFCDGKMLPLRPPPSTQFLNSDKRLGVSSTASSPGGRSSMLRVPFMRQRSGWNDEFDPFMAALNKVKRDDNPTTQLRRAKSLSPLRRPNIHHQHKRLGLSPNAKDGLGPMGPDGYGPSKTSILQSRKQRMKKFLLKNASFGKDASVEKKEQRAPLLLRKLQNSGKFRLGSKSNSIMRITKEMKALMKHRARVLFCLVKGIGFHGSKKLS